MDVRRLGPDDLDALWVTRLDALASDPDAFLRTYDEELARGPEHLARGFADSHNGAVFGAFADGRMVGMVGVYRESPVKLRHKAQIWGMFVAAPARGQGLGGRMLDLAIAHARDALKVRQVHLSVEPGHESALRLYRSRGFVAWGVEPRETQDADRPMDGVHMWLDFG